MDLVTLALAKSYTDKEIQKAEMGDIQLDAELGKSGFAADSGAVKEYVDNAINNIPAPVQSDWEQNDPAAADHIKNRPCHLNTLLNCAVDTPQDGGIYKLWDFRGNASLWSRYLSKENIVKRPNQKLENESKVFQRYLIYLGMYMPPVPGYKDEPWLSGVYGCSGLLGSSSYPFVSIGGSNYKVKITSMTYYFVFDVTTLDEENSALFNEFGLYVQPDDNWNNKLPLQGIMQINQVFQIDSWFIPETVARVEDIPVTSVNGQTGDVVINAAEQIQSDWNQNDETAKDFIKNKPDIASDEDVMNMLSDLEIINPITTSDGSILISPTGEIYTL